MRRAETIKVEPRVPALMRKQMQAEAARLDRSMSWVMQQAWKRARSTIRQLPSQAR